MRRFCPNCSNTSKLMFSSRDYSRQPSNESFHYYRCNKCGTIFLDPVPNHLENYYNDSYYAHAGTMSELRKNIELDQDKLDLIAPFISKGSLLEIGPGSGGFAYLSKKAGFEVTCIEMNERSSKFLTETIGVKSYATSNTLDAVKQMGAFDVIALWHAIEHLPHACEIIDELTHHINPGGVIILALPNSESIQFKLFKGFWFHVDAPRHIIFFPESAITRKMELHGFKKIFFTTNDRNALRCDEAGWEISTNRVTQHYWLHKMLVFVMRIIKAILGKIEKRNGRGSAFTVIYQKYRFDISQRPI